MQVKCKIIIYLYVYKKKLHLITTYYFEYLFKIINKVKSYITHLYAMYIIKIIIILHITCMCYAYG